MEDDDSAIGSFSPRLVRTKSKLHIEVPAISLKYRESSCEMTMIANVAFGRVNMTAYAGFSSCRLIIQIIGFHVQDTSPKDQADGSGRVGA